MGLKIENGKMVNLGIDYGGKVMGCSVCIVKSVENGRRVQKIGEECRKQEKNVENRRRVQKTGEEFRKQVDEDRKGEIIFERIWRTGYMKSLQQVYWGNNGYQGISGVWF